MFFTIESIKSFVVDLDSFAKAPAIFQGVLAAISSYELAFVTSDKNADFSSLPIRQNRIFRAETESELLLFKNVLRKAIIACGLRRSATVFLTMDHGAPLQAAEELLLGTILYTPLTAFNQNKLAIYQNMPDFLVHDLPQLQVVLSGQTAGHFAESAVADKKLQPHTVKQNSVFHFEITPADGIPVHFSGRYFRVEDARHHLHPLSLRIINAKRNPERQADLFASIFALLIMWKTKGAFDIIAVVPPKPGQTDRNGVYAAKLAECQTFRDAKIGDRVLLDAVKCVRDYGSLKLSGGANQRAEAIKGAFVANPNVRGKKVVLIDDVYSTGSTMNECITTLLAAGAAEVFPVVLAYHPLHSTSLGKLDDSQPTCSKCSGKLVPRFNSKNGQVFFGCENFQTGGSHDMRPFVEVQRQRIINAEPQIMKIDDEVDAWNVFF